MAGVRRTTVVVILLEGTEGNISGVFIISTIGATDRTMEKLLFAVTPH